MDVLLQTEIGWVIAVQSLGGWLEAPMRFFSFLGTQDFFFLVLPLVYWSVDARLGLRVAFILTASATLNYLGKLWHAGPRPYWVSGEVQAYSSESSFGVPSGHAQKAVAVWGTLATSEQKTVQWCAAALIFLIGFSRIYLGVHFPHDVIAGWLLGSLLLWLCLHYWDSAAGWLNKKNASQQILLAFIVSTIMIALGLFSVNRLDGYVFPAAYEVNALRSSDVLPDPVSLEDLFTLAGTFFGMAVGAAWIASKGGYQADGPGVKRALRFFVGLIGVLILWRGLGMIFPQGEDFLSYFMRYIRYTLVGFWIIAGAPWLFFRIKLADTPKI
ncbi:MAG: phosphatase PAP2 family protein [Anaerolineales bacterium]|nr:phosphatase PAP2 family protein [Anaerolineales bacterium]